MYTYIYIYIHIHIYIYVHMYVWVFRKPLMYDVVDYVVIVGLLLVQLRPAPAFCIVYYC